MLHAIWSVICRTRNSRQSPAPATRPSFRTLRPWPGISARSCMNNSVAIDKRRLRESFDKAAPGYDAAAVLQHEVCRRMLSRLELVKSSPRTILDAGCGTGNAVPDLSERFPRATLYALDIAPTMLCVAA